MPEKKEIAVVIIGIIIMTILVSFTSSDREVIIDRIPTALIISLVIVLVSVFAKKITASKIDVKIEHKIFEWERYWWSKGSHLKKPIPMGIIFPLVLLFLSWGTVKFFAFFEFKSQALVSKAVKKYGRYRFSNVNEWDDALIGFYGLLAVLALAIITRFINPVIFPFQELSRYSIWYALCNMIPLVNLDGTKILFGSRPLYILSLVLLAVAGFIVFI